MKIYAEDISYAQFKICKNKKDESFISKNKLPLVVKADGLAAGKGVTICKSKKKYLNFKCNFKGKFKSSKKLVLEDFGGRVNYFIVDKFNYKFLVQHKTTKELKKILDQTPGVWELIHLRHTNRELEKQTIEK